MLKKVLVGVGVAALGVMAIRYALEISYMCGVRNKHIPYLDDDCDCGCF